MIPGCVGLVFSKQVVMVGLVFSKAVGMVALTAASIPPTLQAEAERLMRKKRARRKRARCAEQLGEQEASSSSSGESDAIEESEDEVSTTLGLP